MTTLAYDGITLAADSQVTSGSFRYGDSPKIFKLKGGKYVACSGSFEVFPLIVVWLNGGPEVELLANDTFNGLVVSSDGSAMEISNNMRLFPACIPWAGGSGEQIALTAMRCGKSAKEAVAVACELDTLTGGKIQSIKIIK